MVGRRSCKKKKKKEPYNETELPCDGMSLVLATTKKKDTEFFRRKYISTLKIVFEEKYTSLWRPRREKVIKIYQSGKYI